jgi:outer membrane receptor protein involved in Fe transport
MRFCRQAFALMALLILSLTGEGGGFIKGTVSTGPADQRTYLANIQLSLQCDGTLTQPRTAATDDAGKFSFSDLPPGHCTLKVTDAQAEETTTSIDVGGDRPVEVDLHVRIRTLCQDVTVTGEQSQVRVDTSSSDTAAPVISQEALQSAPLINERFQDALPLLPGVVRGPDGLINIKGARPGQSGTLVNSTSAANPVTGEEAISLPLEAVASVKVLSNPFSSEYGQFAGGITEVETRSGTDEWKYLVSDFFPRARFRGGKM